MVSTSPAAVPVLFHMNPTWTSIRIVQLLDELSLSPDQVEVRVPTYAALKRDPAMVALNPLRRLPILLLPSGTVVLETGAIAQLLLERYDRDHRLMPAAGASDDARAHALMWTHFATSTAYALSSRAYVATVGIPPADRDADLLAAVAADWVATVVPAVGAALADGRPYVLGAAYSAADVLLTFDFALLGWLGVDRADVVGGDDRVGGWLDRVMRRPSYRRAYAAMDKMVPYTAPAAGGL